LDFKSFLTTAFFVTLLLAGVANAIDPRIRIIDSHGLIRGQALTGKQSLVTVILTSPMNSEKRLNISNTDGLLPEIEGEIVSEQKVIFHGVKPGTWRITNSQIGIKEVTISSE